MKKLLSKYMNSLPEQFNDNFIMSRNDDKIIEHVRDIFKSLETIPEIHINPEESKCDSKQTIDIETLKRILEFKNKIKDI